MAMKLFLFILLAGYAACSDENFDDYDTTTSEPKEALKVYWNVPTFQCASKKVAFENLYEQFGIIQNTNDKFQGDKIALIYNPGLIPAIIKNKTNGELTYRNGGIPQKGNLEEHLEAFRKDLDLKIPDNDFNGIGVLGYDALQPVFRQNFYNLEPYKTASYALERELHGEWQDAEVEAEAKSRFEEAAKNFMQSTIAEAKLQRPNARWGFYGFPYCYNMATNTMIEECAARVPEENDQLQWLWSDSNVLYPSVYSSVNLSESQLTSQIRGRINEAKRLAAQDTEILPYFRLTYRDAGFFSETDLDAALSTFSESNTGFIIWGSSNDVNTVTKCNDLYNYVVNVFGPAVLKYTKPE